jgi:CRP-like cAMP-binding protein
MDAHLYKSLANSTLINLCKSIEELFSEKTRLIKIKQNQDFIIEGTMVQGLFLIKEGIVKVTKTGLNGREQILRLSKQGEIVGYRGFGTNAEYQIGANSITDCELYFYPNNLLEEALKENIQLTYNFMLFYAQELSNSETKVRKFAQMTVREKVIDSILYVHRKFGQAGDYLNLQLSRKDLAAMAGTTDEQVIRVISALEKENILRKKGKKTGIINVEKLKKEIAEHNFFISP